MTLRRGGRHRAEGPSGPALRPGPGQIVFRLPSS